ncbi:MAG: cation-translocating P-type ATPase [Flavisolibacter sp.]
MNWYNLDLQEITVLTGSSPNGLSSASAEQKLLENGYNQLAEKKKKPAWVLFLNQFKDFMILVLIAAAIISGFVGDSTDVIIILVIVFLNAVIGFTQEYRAEKAMEALKKMAMPQSSVLRDGHVKVIPSLELVTGDVVLLDAGNTIPADLRLAEVHGLKVMEASLTGESVPVEKTAAVLKDENLPLGDCLNMVFKGTQVTVGHAKGMVVATGMDTEIGHIARMLQEKESTTPLQKRMADFGKKLSYLILFICLILFVVGLLRGEEPMQMLLVAISLAVAAIPEALPALITIALSIGAKRLVKKNVLIRKLTAVETLGSVTYICTDKTGTLTENKMKVVEVKRAKDESPFDTGFHPLLVGMALNHTVIVEGDVLTGDPTEVAMVQYFLDEENHDGYEELQKRFPLEAELPFDSDRKCMTTIHRFEGKYLALSKGAVEFVVSRLHNGDDNDAITEESTSMASNGLRVLAFAYRLMDELPRPFSYDVIESELQFAGLVGMIDPPRTEIVHSIAECKAAGIHPVMITGDHKQTAAAIARDIGLLEEGEMVITGSELSMLEPEDLESRVERIRVYARVSPQQKLNIVQALQKRNHFVAMTGDGVNDAPSLRKANIGIAMGITGTDVSKEAAHMILLDDNFTSIVRAVGEGRRIYDNIRKFVKYIMTCNSAEIWTIFLAPLLGLPIPLLPIHILWINLITDGLPGLALSLESAEKNIMRRPPRKPDESLFAEGIGVHIVWVGLFMAFITLGTQAWSIQDGNAHWQTMVFTVLALAQLAHVFAIRSDHEFIFKKGVFSNPALVLTVLLTFGLQMAVVYLPAGNAFFKTEPLTFSELLICIGGALLVFHAVELEKLVRTSFRKR